MIQRFNGQPAVAHYPPPKGEGAAAVEGRALAFWRRVERMIADHPKQSLIAAAAAGAVLGWLTKRR
jgi:hypothetical protein